MKTVLKSKTAIMAGVAAMAIAQVTSAFATDEFKVPPSYGDDTYEKWIHDDGHGLTVNANKQKNDDSDFEADASENIVEVDLDDYNNGKIGDRVNIELNNSGIDASASANSASNALVVGTGIVHEDSTVSLDPSAGPIIQANKQINDDVDVDATANYNEVEIETETKSQVWPGSKGIDLAIKNTSINSAAVGNSASNTFLGDVSDVGRSHGYDGSDGPYTLGYTDSSEFANVSVQKNRDTWINAETKYNDVLIDPDGKYSSSDFSISNTTLTAGAVGNDVTNTVGLTTGGKGSPITTQFNVQKNVDVDVYATASSNRVAIDPSYRGTYGKTDFGVNNTSIKATAIGNRAVNRLGGPDLGGVKK